MKLTFYGATRTTTGSKYLLETNGHRVLIECGMFQGRREKTREYNTVLPFDPTALDALLLSHAHIDHAGLAPGLCKRGYAAPIYCTEATADLCGVMLLDSAHIQEQDALFVTKKQQKKGLPAVEPLYTQADAEAAIKQLVGVAYDHTVEVVPGLRATWQDAGHILGSGMIALEAEEGGRRVRLGFSGDLGRGHNDILRDPAHLRELDFLWMESTYGSRVHEPLENVNDRVCAIINQAIGQGGKIIIPAFSVGRTQQLLYTLYHLAQTGCIPALPIHVDSPLSAQATEVFRRHPECFNPAFFAVMLNGSTPFSRRNLQYTQSVADSMALNDLHGPRIIISASGMAEAGRIRHHLRNHIDDPRNTILIVGWCAPHTLGSHLASGHKEVTIFGETHRVRARIETIQAFSGHADMHELRAWAAQVTGPLRTIAVVHGEEEAAFPFAETLRGLRPGSNVIVPEFGQSVEV